MQLVEQHVIRDTDPRYAAIDRAAFASKNLYNAANYVVRQAYIHAGVYLNFAEVYQRIKDQKPTRPCRARSATICCANSITIGGASLPRVRRGKRTPRSS